MHVRYENARMEEKKGLPRTPEQDRLQEILAWEPRKFARFTHSHARQRSLPISLYRNGQETFNNDADDIQRRVEKDHVRLAAKKS